jgi:uncharacterized protein (TIGR02391 family)
VAKRASLPEKVVPTITPQRAIELLQQQLGRFGEIARLHSSNQEVSKWVNTTAAIMRGAFGEPHPMVEGFNSYMSFMLSDMPPSYYEGLHQEDMARRKGILESSIEQLQILAPPIAQVAPGQYQFHAEIERVSGHLFRDGHYKQAALEAYIRVIEEVKTRSGLNLDGDTLMNQAFSSDASRMPVLRFNAMSSDAERDEQKGFMFLFKGMVLHRNYKAHSNQLFNDPLRAHEYLAMASLLMRMLELARR